MTHPNPSSSDSDANHSLVTPPASGEPAAVAAPPASSTTSGMSEAAAREVLSVRAGADVDVIEASARRLSRKHHPDSGEVPDRERFKRVQRAKASLVD